ncbi:MAG: serine/threonine protein kinase [Proteobacteria bacterium]|nr:serine/threonine protein kinase [Pseudomonadota bacterium]MCP4920091.1 serine/threonine protein kinase [Pseudomonadota bacterium]
MSDESPPLADGRYRLVEILGEGGMAIVYRAYDERLQVYRAVKVLSPELQRHTLIQERFLNEARTMARLHHPNIVGVHDVGSDGNRSYIVMEMVQGGSLMDYVAEHGTMHPRLACDATLAILGALGVAHDAGVIHRDIKPQNVLLSAKGKAKVTDFGIAHVADDSSDRSLTKTGSVMGTWGFMAPEQRVSARKVDGRSDIYAVGATLYTLLTTEMPVDLFAAEMDESVLAGIEPLLAAIIKNATRYRPSDRYADVEAMEEALRDVRRELPEVTAEVPKLGHGARELRSTPPPVQTKEATSMTMVPPGEFVAEHTKAVAAAASEGLGGLTDPRATAAAEHTMAVFGDEEPVEAPPPQVLQPSPPPSDTPSSGTLHDGIESLPSQDDDWRTVQDVDWDDEPEEKDRKPLIFGAVALLALLGGGGWFASQQEEEPIGETPVAEEVIGDPVEEPKVEEPKVEEPKVEEPKVEEPVEEPVEDPTVEDPVEELVPDLPAPVRDPVRTPVEEPVEEVVELVEEPIEEVVEELVVEEPAAPLPGRVVVTGDALKVILVDSAGKSWPTTGSIPAGTYQVKAAFADGIPHVALNGLVVAEGASVTLKCYGAFGTCKAE